jgi:hypothetical protein
MGPVCFPKTIGFTMNICEKVTELVVRASRRPSIFLRGWWFAFRRLRRHPVRLAPWRLPRVMRTWALLGRPLGDDYRLASYDMLIQGNNPIPRLKFNLNRYGYQPPPALNLLVGVRELIEFRSWQDKYPVANLYANWAVHTRLFQSAAGFALLSRINNQLATAFQSSPSTSDDDAVMAALLTSISAELNMMRLRNELISMFSKERLGGHFKTGH